jgi:hypothetical protein
MADRDRDGEFLWRDLLPADGPPAQVRGWASLVPRPPEKAGRAVRDLVADRPEGVDAVCLIRGERRRAEPQLFEEGAGLSFPKP